MNVPTERNIFFYVIRGEVIVNGENVNAFQLAEFKNDGEEISITADKESVVLFGHGKPLKEPVVAQGPFVMNTEEEIHQAYEDFRNGKFGTWT